MPFIPLQSTRSRPADFPRVSAAEQVARDYDAEQIVGSEFNQDMPDENRTALTSEYRQRFGQEAPTAQRGFIPLDQADDQPRGFIPLEPEQPSLLKTIALNNPATAIGETVANLGSQMVALPVAGIAGIGTAAANALGLTDREPADVVRSVGERLTYQPRGEMGRAATEAVMYPFQKLAEAGQYVGDKTLNATGSPVAATAVDTAIQTLPMLITPGARGARAVRERFGRPEDLPRVEPAMAPAPITEPRGFIPLEEVADGQTTQTLQARAERMGSNDPQMHGTEATVLAELRRQGDQGLPGMDGELPALPRRYGTSTDATALAGPAGRESGLLPRELRLDDAGATDTAPTMQPESVYPRRDAAISGSGPAGWTEPEHLVLPDGERVRSGVQSGQALQALDVADLQRRDAAVAGMGEANRRVEKYTVAEDGEARYVGRAGIDTRQPSGFIPLRDSIDAAAHEAATSPLNSLPQPTRAQIESGNYKKGAVRLQGLDIAIENPAGSVRSGISPEGRPWQNTMNHHYGYLRRTVGKDGDPVDVFLGPRPESQKVFVIDQIDPRTGKFDEHKAVLGADSLPEARAIYHANYEPGWRGAAAISEMSMPEFKDWARNGDTKKPLAIPSILGKRVTEYTDTQLAKWQGKLSKLLSDAARAKVAGEIERRASVDTGRSARTRESFDADMAAGVQNGTWNPGAHYTPFVDQVRAPTTQAKTVADLPAPLRREQIVGNLAKALDTTIYEGRVKGQKRLGFFRPGVNEVRIKRAADIEVAAHEVAHLIDHRVPAISYAWRTDKALREELKSVSYDQKSVKEGFAEGVRLFLTQPDVLEARAPKVHAWLESFTQTHKYGPALRKAQADMTEWFGQDALNRARSKIGTDKPFAEYFDRFWDKFRQSTVDDLHGIMTMEYDLTGKLNPNGPYESARLSRASASIADGAVRFGYPVKNPDGSFSWKGRGLEDILKPVAESLDDALLYFVGRSARELHGQGREHLFTPGEIDGMLRLRTPEREKAFQDYQEWNRGILDFAEAQNIINPESRRLWQRTQYLPFHRVEQPGGLKGKPGEWSGIQALTGGTTNIKDVLGNMIGNAAMLLDKAVKNEARLKVAKLAQREGGGKFMVKIDTEARPVKISGDQVIEAMLKKYGIAIDGDAPAFFEFLIKGQPPAGKNVVAVLQQGKPVWFEVGDPILYRALSAIDRPVQSEVVKWLGMPKRIGQASITTVPDFWLANIARDTLMGSVMSRAGFKPILDSLDGMRMRITKDPIYKEWVANGGGLSSIYLDEGHFRTKLERFYTRQGIDYRTVLDTPGKLLNMVETLGDAFESSTRLGEFKRALAQGENPRHAAYLARDVSTDFAMKGDSKALGFMYDTVMFLRPAVVSWDRLYRGLAHDPNKGAIAAKAGLIALASAGLYLLNKDDPRYADLPDWDRDANWHFFIGDQHFRWPKIWEIGAMASAAERSVEKIMAGDPLGLGKDFARILANTFSVNLMPQIIAPLAEQATNRNAFTKAPIETPGMENVQPFLRAKPGTSETMKAAGMATRDLPESMQVNPARAEALLRGYFNTWALYGLMLSDQALFGDKLPAKRADELPVVRRFYANEPAKHTKYESMFYDLLQESKRLRGTMRELDDMGLKGYADQKEASPLATEAKPLERAAKNLSGINKDMEAVRRDQVLTPTEKRQRLDALTVERNALLKAAVTDSQAAQKDAGWKSEVQKAEAALQRMQKPAR